MAVMRNIVSALALWSTLLQSPSYAQTDAPLSGAENGWGGVLYLLLIVLIIAIALFSWFLRKQRGKQSRDD